VEAVGHPARMDQQHGFTVPLHVVSNLRPVDPELLHHDKP
jgi:hypothetical protein